MISAKFVIKTILALLFVSIAGVILYFNGMDLGRYLVFFSVAPAAILGFFAGIAMIFGKLNNDLKSE